MTQGTTTLSTIAILVPLFGLAGSAVAYVVKLYFDKAERRHARFFEILSHIDNSNSVAAKIAAIYSLRRFREHADFVVRFCETQRSSVRGGGAPQVVDELDRTADFLRRYSNAPNN